MLPRKKTKALILSLSKDEGRGAAAATWRHGFSLTPP
jgi:hypothetical protein